MYPCPSINWRADASAELRFDLRWIEVDAAGGDLAIHVDLMNGRHSERDFLVLKGHRTYTFGEHRLICGCDVDDGVSPVRIEACGALLVSTNGSPADDR